MPFSITWEGLSTLGWVGAFLWGIVLLNAGRFCSLGTELQAGSPEVCKNGEVHITFSLLVTGPDLEFLPCLPHFSG